MVKIDLQDHWNEIAARWNLRIQAPFTVQLSNGPINVPVLLRDFGTPRACCFFPISTNIDLILMSLLNSVSVFHAWATRHGLMILNPMMMAYRKCCKTGVGLDRVIRLNGIGEKTKPGSGVLKDLPKGFSLDLGFASLRFEI